jgi:hypothetical protein
MDVNNYFKVVSFSDSKMVSFICFNDRDPEAVNTAYVEAIHITSQGASKLSMWRSVKGMGHVALIGQGTEKKNIGDILS